MASPSSNSPPHTHTHAQADAFVNECRQHTLERMLLSLVQRHGPPCSLLVMVSGLAHKLNTSLTRALHGQGVAESGALRNAVHQAVMQLQLGWQGVQFRQVVDASQAATELYSLTRAVAEQPYAHLAAVCRLCWN